MAILVTGATGTTGSEIVKQLSAAGAKVRALVRNPQKAASIQKPNVEIALGDLSKPETLDAALRGADHVLLLSSPDPNQVELQSDLIQAAQRAGTQHLVKLSALGADVNAAMRFGRWHGQTEKQLEESGIPFTNLRPNGFMQNMLAFAGSIAAAGKFYADLGDAKISFVDIRDIAAVAVKTLTEPGHVGKSYDITGPEALSYGEVAKKLSAALGKKVEYVNVSTEDAKKGMLGLGMPEWLVDAIAELYAVYRAGGAAIVTNVVADVAKKKPISFDQFARDYAGAFRG